MEEQLKYTLNRYSDVILDPSSLPNTVPEFRESLKMQLENWRETGKMAVWLEIPMDKTHLIWVAIELGFKGHHCTEDYFMLTLWLGDQDDVKIPLYGTHIVRVEALLLREDPRRPGVKQVLVVREKYSQGKRGRDWKLLSGAVEPGEFIDQAVVREVYEEVGLKARFCAVLGHGGRVSAKFGRNEIFFCCHVILSDRDEELNSDFLRLQESELIDAKWMDVSQAMQEWKDNYKLRGLEKRCLMSAVRNKGLVNFISEDQRGNTHRLLAHFVGIPPYEIPRKVTGIPRKPIGMSSFRNFNEFSSMKSVEF